MIRVLVVDDSPVARKFLIQALTVDGIQVVGEAGDPYAARDRIVELKPDVVVLDVMMPKMDGITFLRRLMHYFPVPTVICSSFTRDGGDVALSAYEAGAVEVIGKPDASYPLLQMGRDLVAAVRAAAVARQRADSPEKHAVQLTGRGDARLIAIGASTGGTAAVEAVLRALPREMPPIAIVQHMPPYITQAFAARLKTICRIDVREARDGDVFEDGLALVAPGGSHLLVERGATGLVARVNGGPRVNGHRPAVDVLFRSVAEEARERAVGVLLTGMGRDGAEGMLAMHGAGARTLAQDEATSVVFGMPKAAIELGAADQVVPLPEMSAQIARACSLGRKPRARRDDERTAAIRGSTRGTDRQ
jgi:two-component system chemotaxis response regulator CheB